MSRKKINMIGKKLCSLDGFVDDCLMLILLKFFVLKRYGLSIRETNPDGWFSFMAALAGLLYYWKFCLAE